MDKQLSLEKLSQSGYFIITPWMKQFINLLDPVIPTLAVNL